MTSFYVIIISSHTLRTYLSFGVVNLLRKIDNNFTDNFSFLRYHRNIDIFILNSLGTLQTRLTLYLRLEGSKTGKQNQDSVDITVNNQEILNMKNNILGDNYESLHHQYYSSENDFSDYNEFGCSYGKIAKPCSKLGYSAAQNYSGEDMMHSDMDMDMDEDMDMDMEEDENMNGFNESYSKYLLSIQNNKYSNSLLTGQLIKPVLIDISCDNDDDDITVLHTTSTTDNLAFQSTALSSIPPASSSSIYSSHPNKRTSRRSSSLFPLTPSSFLTQSPLDCPKLLQPGDSLMSYMQLIIKKVSDSS